MVGGKEQDANLQRKRQHASGTSDSDSDSSGSSSRSRSYSSSSSGSRTRSSSSGSSGSSSSSSASYSRSRSRSVSHKKDGQKPRTANESLSKSSPRKNVLSSPKTNDTREKSVIPADLRKQQQSNSSVKSPRKQSRSPERRRSPRSAARRRSPHRSRSKSAARRRSPRRSRSKSPVRRRSPRRSRSKSPVRRRSASSAARIRAPRRLPSPMKGAEFKGRLSHSPVKPGPCKGSSSPSNERSQKKPSATERMSQSPKNQGPLSRTSNTKICVWDLTKNVKQTHIQEIFSTFGEVKHIDMPCHKVHRELTSGFAYVEFEKQEDAKRATDFMNGAQIDGQTVAASLAVESPHNTEYPVNGSRERPRHFRSRSPVQQRASGAFRRSPVRRSPPRRQRLPYGRSERSPQKRKSPFHRQSHTSKRGRYNRRSRSSSSSSSD